MKDLLKKIEILETDNATLEALLSQTTKDYIEATIEIERYKKAIEILKDKGVVPYQSRMTSKYKYLSVGIEDLIDLTNDEYEALKEVFEWN